MIQDVPDAVSPRYCLVLASKNPQNLASFYTDLFSGEFVTAAPEGSVTVHLSTGIDMVLYQYPRKCLQSQPDNRLALCLRCTDLEDMRQRATRLGAQVLEPIRQKPFGREQWLLDPENNRVLLWEDPTPRRRQA